jgi:ATP-dependent Zn protease
MARQDIGCISYIGITGIVIMSLYVLLTNSEQFFESAFNILGSFAIVVLIVYFTIFFPNNSSEKKKGKPNIISEVKSKENLIVKPKISKKEKILTKKENDIEFLEKFVTDLKNYSRFEIKLYGKIEIDCWLLYKSKSKIYKFKETFDNYEEAIAYLKNLK